MNFHAKIYFNQGHDIWRFHTFGYQGTIELGLDFLLDFWLWRRIWHGSGHLHGCCFNYSRWIIIASAMHFYANFKHVNSRICGDPFTFTVSFAIFIAFCPHVAPLDSSHQTFESRFLWQLPKANSQECGGVVQFLYLD